MVNYRGSTGYGQKLANAIFGDQNGGEAKDVLAGVDAALAKYPWLEPTRLGIEGGSYGGQLANWLVTQTIASRPAIPRRDLEPGQLQLPGLLPRLSGRRVRRLSARGGSWTGCGSARRFATYRVKTPVLFLHGENDNDVPIAEAEQFFIALKDVGVRDDHGPLSSRGPRPARNRTLVDSIH